MTNDEINKGYIEMTNNDNMTETVEMTNIIEMRKMLETIE